MYKFFKADLDALDFKIAELGRTIREAGRQMGSATEDGEREHDNPELEDAMRRFEMWSHHLRELNGIRSRATTINPNDVKADRVYVGCDVTFVDQNEDERTVTIGSYMPHDASLAISYNAPVAKLLMGLGVGDTREGVIAGKRVQFEVLSIKPTIHR
ncbi:GreA/GreB family elongation factor [Patescibacteria group bacterium]|nr:GreA/GreB family elongation factor [Patescibacteria group bacterium]